MARTVIPLQVMGLNGGGDDSIGWTAGDSVNGHYFDNTSENVILIVKNTDGSSKTVLVKGNTADSTITCPATTGYSVYGPFPAPEFNQRAAAYLGQTFVDLVAATGVSFAAMKFDPSK